MLKIIILIFFSILLIFTSFLVKAQEPQPNNIFIGKWISGDSIGFEISKNGLAELDKLHNSWKKTFYSYNRNNWKFTDTALISTPLAFQSWAVFSFLSTGKTISHADGTTKYDFIETARFSILKMELIDTNTMKLEILKVYEINSYNKPSPLIVTAEMKNNLFSKIKNESSIILTRIK